MNPGLDPDLGSSWHGGTLQTAHKEERGEFRGDAKAGLSSTETATEAAFKQESLRQEDCQECDTKPGLHSEFINSLDYRVKPCLRKPKQLS